MFAVVISGRKSLIIAAPPGARVNIWNTAGAAMTARPTTASTNVATRRLGGGLRSAQTDTPAIMSPGRTKNQGNIQNGGSATRPSKRATLALIVESIELISSSILGHSRSKVATAAEVPAVRSPTSTCA